MGKMSPVVHFEMPAKDRKRVAQFYAKAFGWKMKELGGEMGNYVLAETTATDEKTGRPTKPGAINGGFFEYQEKEGFQYPSVVIAVDDLQASIEMVKQAGGQIKGPPMDIPNIGKYVLILDSEGNRVGMLQPGKME